jgi:hypothetical protein
MLNAIADASGKSGAVQSPNIAGFPCNRSGEFGGVSLTLNSGLGNLVVFAFAVKRGASA